MGSGYKLSEADEEHCCENEDSFHITLDVILAIHAVNADIRVMP